MELLSGIQRELSQVPLEKLVVVGTIAGLTCHQIFKRVEPSLYPTLYTFFAISLVLPVLFWSIISPTVLISSYLLSLFASIAVYRLWFFHPLSGFQGPTIAKLSKFYGAFITAKGKWPLKTYELHKKYGTIVRVGPNELSVNEISAIQTIYGTNGFVKGPFYDAFMKPEGAQPMFTLRDHSLHAQRRKVYDRAFTGKALEEYQGVLLRDVGDFVKVLGQQVKKNVTLDMNDWLGYFTFDFMGELLFGGTFDMKTKGDVVGMWPILNTALDIFVFFGNIPWATEILAILPANEDQKRWQSFAVQRMTKRTSEGGKHKDMFHYLMGEDRQDEDPELHPFTVLAEIVNMMIAGSDTTATCLSFSLLYLCRDQESMGKLRKEVDEVFPQGEEFDLGDGVWDKLAKMPYLNAVLNESMRLAPPVPRGLARYTPPEGAEIAGTYIPGNTSVSVSSYTIHRNPKYFNPEPEAWRPERWLESEKANWTTNKYAFIPFSYGPYGCAGKMLAYLQMRLCLSALIHQFDLTFDGSFNEEEYYAAIKENFGVHKGPLKLRLSPRS